MIRKMADGTVRVVEPDPPSDAPPSEARKILKARARNLRAMGLSYDAMAERLGVSNYTAWTLINGQPKRGSRGARA